MPDQSSAASEHALMQEVTAPLRTLPDDPLAIVEAEFPVAMRGYDRHAVDDYVEQVSRLVAELHATRSPESAVRRALERVGDQISGILQRAHETAEQITAQSRAEAEDRLEQARRESATMIDAAAQRVRELDADADRIWGERQRIIADAEDLSGQLRAVARDATERFPPAPGPATPEDARTPLGGDAVGADGATAVEDEATEWEVGVPLAAEPEDATETPAAEAELDAAGLTEAERSDGAELAELELDEAGLTDPEPSDDADLTQRFEVPPRLVTDEESTRIIPPASDAAQHRRDG